MAVFQRARSEEQREARRQAILRAAAAMLAEMPVAEVTLNELSRRSGLAKSNVLRYFESREAVLLELLDAAWQDWLTELDQDLAASGARPAADAAGIDAAETGADAPVADRADRVALVVAASLAARPMLCDLISAQAAVLERNVSPRIAAQYKRASLTGVAALGGLILHCVPELGQHDSFQLAGTVLMMTSALWPHTQPSVAMLAAYAAEPDLAAMRLDFTVTLGEALQVMTAGLLARSARPKSLHRAERVGTAPVTRGAGPGFLGCYPGTRLPDAFGEAEHSDRGALGVRQPVDGQAPGDVVDRGADPRDLRVVGVPVRHEILPESRADEIGQRHPLLQAHGQSGGIHAHQPRSAAAVLAPVDEHLAEAAVVALVSGNNEPLRVDRDGGGVAAPVSCQGPANANHYEISSELIYEFQYHRA